MSTPNHLTPDTSSPASEWYYEAPEAGWSGGYVHEDCAGDDGADTETVQLAGHAEAHLVRCRSCGATLDLTGEAVRTA